MPRVPAAAADVDQGDHVAIEVAEGVPGLAPVALVVAGGVEPAAVEDGQEFIGPVVGAGGTCRSPAHQFGWACRAERISVVIRQHPKPIHRAIKRLDVRRDWHHNLEDQRGFVGGEVLGELHR
jgi:hypothetical protein